MMINLEGTLTLVGAGKMGAALLSGWLSGAVPKNQIQIVDPNPPSETAELISNNDLTHNPDPSPSSVLILAVKPQILDTVLASVSGFIDDQTLVISIAAGRTLSSLAKLLPASCAIVRTMPNLPAEIGMGMTVACANDQVNEDQTQLCDQLLSAVGDVGWVEDEHLIDAVTAVSGSGPAYIFHFAECLANAGIEAGLEPKLAARLARATVSGAGALLHQSDLDASRLRENVTSPGGTTAAALDVLMSDEGLDKLIKRAVEAAKKRSQELSS